MKTPNCPTPTSNPWNKGLKPSDSHVQPMERRLQTVQLSHPTHGMKTSNCLTLTSNPCNKGIKPPDSPVQPLPLRPQIVILYPWNHALNSSNSHLQPIDIPTPPT